MRPAPLGILNAAGFAFQLAVEDIVIRSADRHQWKITSREHGWRDEDDNPRFIDLVLTKGSTHLVIECKRHREAHWVFLVPDPPERRQAEPRRHFRARYLKNRDTSDGPRAVSDLSDFQLDPRSWESSFCAVQGGSDRDQQMLDRICAELTRSADALLSQQLKVHGRGDLRNLILRDNAVWIAVPVIVTTASLSVCRFDPAAVSASSGELQAKDARFEQIQAIRYRKSFDAPQSTQGSELDELEPRAQRTLCIVGACSRAEGGLLDSDDPEDAKGSGVAI